MFMGNQRCKILTENFGTFLGFGVFFLLCTLKSLVNEGTPVWTSPIPSA